MAKGRQLRRDIKKKSCSSSLCCFVVCVFLDVLSLLMIHVSFCLIVHKILYQKTQNKTKQGDDDEEERMGMTIMMTKTIKILILHFGEINQKRMVQ